MIVSLALVATLTVGQEVKKHNLPVLFQYEEPGHSVAVFRGAELKQAIAAGLVPGFGNLGRQGKKIDTSADDMAAAKAAVSQAAWLSIHKVWQMYGTVLYRFPEICRGTE